MNPIRVALAGTLCGLILAASAASAQVDVELAFDPPTASPGDVVALVASMENKAPEEVMADLELSIVWGGFSYAVIANSVPIAAGAKVGGELPFFVPPFLDQLTLSLTATVGELSDTATATLTVLGASKAASAKTSVLRGLARDTATMLGAPQSSDATESSTFGEIKRRYR